MIYLFGLIFLLSAQSALACTCSIRAQQFHSEMSKKKSKYSECKKKSKSCSDTCSKQDELANMSTKAKDGMAGNYKEASASYSLVKNEADKVHKKCKSDRDHVKKTCGDLSNRIGKAIKDCKARLKISPDACTQKGLAKLESLQKDPKDRNEGCGALAGTMLPQSKKVSGEMFKMLAALAPMIMALSNNKGGETKAPKKKTCEERLAAINKPDLRCSDSDGPCCKQFPCAKGCAAAGIAKTEGVDDADGAAGVVVRTPTSSSKFGISAAEMANDPTREKIEVLEPEAPKYKCNPDVETCEEGDEIETSSSPLSIANSMNSKGLSDSDGEIDNDPETSSTVSKKATIPAPSFDNISGGGAWQGSSMGLGDDGSSSSFDEPKAGGKATDAAAYKQIAPKQGKSPFELINGAYMRVQKKGLLIQ